MSQQGATLQSFNTELVKNIESLKMKKSELDELICKEEEEKNNLQIKLEKITVELERLNESLNKKISSRNDYERTIAETEAAYSKIVESSQVLVNMVKREVACLEKCTNKKMAPEVKK